MIEQKLVNKLLEKNETIALAESVTGGGISYNIVNISNASKVFKGAIVSYQEEVKLDLLKIKKTTINSKSVVSEEVAIEMALNVKNILKTNIGVGVTGNAGPTFEKNTKEKVCYIAVAKKNEVKVEKYYIKSSKRSEAIQEIIVFALNFIVNEI